ncbi:MAG: DUF3857 and transglutaminase domain-containing protein [Thermoanaerobaculaceae bacterium]|nr:DUF3857 and transglutaminase domain-containing protein [Thermoanaerobaculaceae bacterium]
MFKKVILFSMLLCLVQFLSFAHSGGDDVVGLLNSVTKDKYPDADAVIVLDETKVDVEESGLSHVYKRQVVKLLTEEGCKNYSTFRLDYDPASSYAEIKSIKVIKKDKEAILDSASFLDLPQPQSMIYWGPRMKLASIPLLNPDDVIEINTYSKGFVIAYLADGEKSNSEGDERYIPPMRGHYYDVVLFQSDYPIVKKKYTVSLPKDKLLNAKVYNGEVSFETSYDKEKIYYTFLKENVPPVKREPRMVEDTDAMPKVVLATVEDWPQKSRWFYEVNENAKAFEWNEDIAKEVEKITKGLKTDDEKRKALLAWVARQIRYSGITMGKGEGYTLHPGIMTFNDRAGVCKDIAGMLITMLRCAGYKTYPAMTMAGARVEDVPADQFNHCVVAVELSPGEYKLYDPTWCPFSREVWSSAEKPQNYVIGTEKGEILMETPPAPPEDNFIKMVSTGSFDIEGNFEGKIRITVGAYSETNLVWAVIFSDKGELRETFEDWVKKISPQAELISFSNEDPVDVNKPFFIELKYKIPNFGVKGENGFYFVSPAAQNMLSNRRLTDFVAAIKGDKRQYDIFLRATRKFIFEETINLPVIAKNKVAEEGRKVDGAASSFEAKSSINGKVFELKETFTVKKKIVPAKDYTNLKDSYEAMKDFGSIRYKFSY